MLNQHNIDIFNSFNSQEYTPSPSIGASDRTPFKHWLLKKELGRMVGVIGLRSPKTSFLNDPVLLVDMCAGDGELTEHCEYTSPSIFTNACKSLDKDNVPYRCIFIEKNKFTFETLNNNVSFKKIELINDDAKNFHIPSGYENNPVFIHCDPNSITNMPMSDSFIESIPKYAFWLVTLGCNVSGTKRLIREEREKWFEFVNRLKTNMSPHHDIILVSLNRDASQWAYMLRIPKVWSEDTVIRIQKSGDSMWRHGVKVMSLNTDKNDFKNELNRLFLTKKENGENI